MFDSIIDEVSDETIPEYDEKISMKIKNETNLEPPPWFVMYERCSIDVKIGLKRALTGNKEDVALMGLIYKGENLTTSLFIVIVMLLASLSPLTGKPGR